jgi:hypothetical protein
MSDINPYSSPQARAGPVRRRTKWRILIVAPLVAFGCIGLATGLCIFLAIVQRPIRIGGGITLWRIVAVGLIEAFASLYIATGIMIWRGRWLIAAIAFAIAVFGWNVVQFLPFGMKL